MVADLGCGTSKQTNAIGVDRRILPGVDVVADVEKGLPFKTNSLNQISANHVFEHLNPAAMIDTMNEIWRAMKAGGLLMLEMPYPGSFGFYQDPTHIKSWNEATPQYFDPEFELYGIYEPRPWRITHLRWDEKTVLQVGMRKIGDQ